MISKAKLNETKSGSKIASKTKNEMVSNLLNSQKENLLDTSVELTRVDLEQMTTNELIDKYFHLERGVTNGRLQQCRILREIRIKFGENDRRFGEFLSQTILSELSTKTVTRMIQVADFFEAKSIEGIAWSSALALAEPRNAQAAALVYKEIAGKNARPVDVLEKINNIMGRIQTSKRSIGDDNYIEGNFTTITSEASVKKADEVNIGSCDNKLIRSEPERAILSLKTSSTNFIIAEKPLEGLTEEELNNAMSLITTLVSNLSKMDRIRLWRALIRKDEN